MKKDKQKTDKVARKAIRKDIKFGLIAKLKEVTAQLGGDSKKLEKEIQKASAKISKKLSKEMKINKSGKLEGGKEHHSPQATEPAKPLSFTKESLPSPNDSNIPGEKTVAKTTKIKRAGQEI